MIRFALLLILALMCENVNAAPGGGSQPADTSTERDRGHAHVVPSESPILAVPAQRPFTLSHPICQTGFTIAMRYDTRNSVGTIIKSVWVRKCTKGRIVYGRKV